MAKYIAILLFLTALIQAHSTPTPQDVIEGLIGTWVGTSTANVNGNVIKESFTETITPIGTDGLGYQSTVIGYIGNQAPTTGVSYAYNNGQLDGEISQNGNTTAVINGSWYVANSTIYGSATAQTATTSFSESTQTFVTGDTLNGVVSYSFGGGAVITAKKILTPVVSFSLPEYTLAYSPNGNFPLNATSPSAGSITYSSDDPSVVSVSGHTATVKGVGTATITASVAAAGYYTSASSSADVTVTAVTPIVSFPQSALNIMRGLGIWSQCEG